MAPAGPDRDACPILRRFAAAGALALALAACASAPPEPSRAERDAQGFNQRAARAFQQGNLAQARSLYEQALRIDASIENADGIAVNLLSLARVEQAAGEPAAAHALLNRALSDAPLALPVARQAEAAARKAQLYLASREPAKAAQWSAQAESLCERSACGVRAGVLNLRALAALESGDTAAAAEYSQRALAAATGEEARAERANALRVSGEIHLARKQGEAAESVLRQALAADQAIGHPARIFRDLMLLGQALEQLGRRDEARAYYQRALAVGTAEGDGTAQRQARAQLERL